MIYSRPASVMVFTKPCLAGPSGIIIQQDRRFGNTFGNGFEIAVQLDITDCTFLSWVLYLIFILALYEIPGSCLQTSPMQPPDHLKCDLMFCCQRFFQSEENNTAGRTGDLCLHLRSKPTRLRYRSTAATASCALCSSTSSVSLV